MYVFRRPVPMPDIGSHIEVYREKHLDLLQVGRMIPWSNPTTKPFWVFHPHWWLYSEYEKETSEVARSFREWLTFNRGNLPIHLSIIEEVSERCPLDPRPT